MAGGMNKAALADAIAGVGKDRSSGIQKGDVVVPSAGVVQSTPVAPQPAVEQPAAAKEAVKGQKSPAREVPSQEAKEMLTARVGFLCTPTQKRQLKQLALDRDTDVSKLIWEALTAKGYLTVE